MHLHPAQEAWFPFILAYEAAADKCSCDPSREKCHNLTQLNPEACAERIAKEQGLDWPAVKACFVSLDPVTGMPPVSSLGFKLEMEAKAATDALVPGHVGVPTVTAGVDGPPIDAPAINALICWVCNAYKGASKPAACRECDPIAPLPNAPSGARKDAQAVSMFGDLLYPRPRAAAEAASNRLHLSQAQRDLADDSLPGYCNITQAAVCPRLMPANGSSNQPERDACVANFCCKIGGIWPHYVCQAGKLPNSPTKLTAVARQLGCSGQLRKGMQALGPVQGVTSTAAFAGGLLDHAQASVILGRQNILARMLGGAESVLSDACAIANGTEGNFPLPPMKISPDMPLGDFCAASSQFDAGVDSYGTPTKSLLGSLFHYYALAEYLLGTSATDLDTGIDGAGLETAITNWQWATRYSVGPESVMTTDDQLVTNVAWLYAACMRANRTADAANALKLLGTTPATSTVLGASDYLTLTQMYTGKLTVAEVTKQMEAAEVSDPETFCTLAYAVGNHHFCAGDRLAAVSLWKRVVATPTWDATGYIAAEAELFNVQGVFVPPGRR